MTALHNKQTHRPRLKEARGTRPIKFQDIPPCSTTDPEIFHPDDTDEETIALAKSICATCTETAKCLEIAFTEHHTEYGIYGGLTPRERVLERKRFHNRAYRERLKAEGLIA